jgi:hypothetical protein
VAFVHGKDAVFSLDDSTGTLRLIKAYLNQVSGLPGARGLSEVTAFGDGGQKNIPGLAINAFSIAGHADFATATAIGQLLNGLRTTTATSSFEYGPEGSTTGKVKYTGECWMTDYEVAASVSDKVSISASFSVDGLVTVTTYP